MELHGVRGMIHEWFCSLSDSSQYVEITNKIGKGKSSCLTVTVGVPKGIANSETYYRPGFASRCEVLNSERSQISKGPRRAGFTSRLGLMMTGTCKGPEGLFEAESSHRPGNFKTRFMLEARRPLSLIASKYSKLSKRKNRQRFRNLMCIRSWQRLMPARDRDLPESYLLPKARIRHGR
ncbi:hypothetical protein J6590_082460 [Homalodisca vitripennis]|nr:hypothetical protein J6590_082460 [Homalodisca vitripennis]